MPILLKRSFTTGSIPTTSSLQPGEVAINVPDGRLYVRQSGSLGNTIRSIPVLGVSNSGSLTLTGSVILSGSPAPELTVIGDISATGSLNITGGITGSLLGTASYALSSAGGGGGSGAGFPYSGSAVITGSLLISSSLPVELQVVGDSRMTGSLIISGSSTSSIFDVYKSGSRVINIEGSQGQLFSVTDSLSGSLMSVNDITGLPILEVFSDDRVVMGSFGRNTLVVSGSAVTVSGSLRAVNQFILPLTGSIAPQTGSMFFSGSFIYVYDGTQYRSASLN